jgi:signal transduction histidine kinase
VPAFHVVETAVHLLTLRITPLLASASALHFAFHALITLTPTELAGRAAGLHALLDALIVVAVVTVIALFRHLVPTLAVPEEPRRSTWLALNYGSALAVCAISLFPLGVSDAQAVDGRFGRHALPMLYVFVTVVLALRHASRLARRGAWRAGPGVGELRSPDVLVVCGALAITGGMLGVSVLRGSAAPGSAASLFFHTALGLGIAVPFVVRMFGRFVRTFLTNVATIAATATVVFGLRALGTGAAHTEVAGLLDLGVIAAILLVIVPGRAWLGRLIEQVVFRRGQARQTELQQFLLALSPELGVEECCRRALGALCRVLNLRGAAILLRDGGTLTQGTFSPGPLERAWPRGAAADALPDRAFTETDLLRGLPGSLREALVESEVVWVVPVTSPRRRWGHLFATEGLLSSASSTDDARDIASFVAQLALVLDGAELLGRTLAVERSLAHAEKLAAIGELAARIAHDIRNPVTAARSLAQQLAREPASHHAAEHGLILEQLERVEQRVAALLRFARREEFRFEPVDLGDLVRATLATLEPRLAATGIVVDTRVDAGLVARGDREKLRHVIINVVENAADALDGTDGSRRLAVSLLGTNGTATLSIADSGPGVAPETLPRLFEPFFSLKEHGTGLGLAIAKRTIDAHGGRIDASSPAGEGLTLRIDLPLARVERA